MRDRKTDLCQRCGSKFKVLTRSARYSPTGAWRVWYCPGCGTRLNEFKPVRSKAKQA